MTFDQTFREYRQKKSELEAGRISPEEFEAAVNALTVTDDQGNRWQIGVQSGKWYRYDGQNWIEANPPSTPSPPESLSSMPQVRVPQMSGIDSTSRSYLERLVPRTPSIAKPKGKLGIVIGCASSLLVTLVVGLISSLVVAALTGNLGPLPFGFAEEPVIAPADTVMTTEVAVSPKATEPPGHTPVPPTATPRTDFEEMAANLEVTQLVLNLSPDGTWRVDGLLLNNADYAVERIKLQCDVYDSQGSVGYSDFAQFRPWIVRPGDESPFSLYLPDTVQDPSKVETNILEAVYVRNWQDNLIRPDVRDESHVVSEYGEVYAIGIISNPSDQPILIDGLCAAIYDGSSKPITNSVFWGPDLHDYLLPGESTLFKVNLEDVFVEEIAFLQDLVIYVNGAKADPRESQNLSLSQYQNTFFDIDGNFHITGLVKNEGEQTSILNILGAVYDGAGALVDVAPYRAMPKTIPPGAIYAYDIDRWDYINQNELLRERVQSFEVLVQQFISPPQNELELTDITIEDARWEILGNGDVNFTGKVLGDLSSYDRLVAVAVIWAPDEITIWGTSSSSLHVDEGAQEHEFSVYVSVDEVNFNPEVATFELVVWGMTEIPQ